ncbi:MAG: PAS domain S-box protein [Acidobacteriota bacterium]|nr:PAS domain S-box protein [Acidobacteriota bacterium]
MDQDTSALPSALPLTLEAYRLLFEANPHPIFLYDREHWRILAVNQAVTTLYGWTQDELHGMTMLDIRPESDRAAFIAAAQATPLEVTKVGTFEHRGKDGRRIIADVTTAGLTLDGGQTARLSVVTDVTEESQLREARERLASIVAGSDDAIILTDLRGRVQTWNPGAERMFGYTEAEIEGASIALIHPPTQGPTFREMVSEVVAGRAVRVFDGLARHKDGHEIIVSMTLSPICDATGQIVGVSGIERDVTERRVAERAVRASEARFARIFSSELILTAVVDVGAQRFKDVNETWLRFFGLKRRDLVGFSVHDFNDTWIDHEQRDTLTEAWKHGRPIQAVEVGFHTRAGARYGLLSVHHSPNADEDIVIMVDITARRQLEAQLSEARRLEALGRLAGGVAHDFNNMLSVMGGYADLLKEQLPSDSPLQRDLGEIKRAAERATELTRQLLAFGRRQMLQPRTVNLNEVVTHSETFLGRVLGENVTLRIALAPETLWVDADASQIEQVLLNLASNARDAIVGGDGVVQIATRTRMLARAWAQERGLPPGRAAELTVRDTGRGMDPETLGRIFEPFFTTKPVGDGTGLGLATVHGIVKQSGGHIDAASTPGQGSLFRVILPLVADPQDSPKPVVRERAQGGTETILLVEDDRAVATLAESLLQRLGYRVVTANSAADAIKAAGAHPDAIDLVLTDVVMPGASGRELVEKLRGSRPGIRALFMSGYPADAVVRSGIAEGDHAFLPKPFTLATLARGVRDALG